MVETHYYLTAATVCSFVLVNLVQISLFYLPTTKFPFFYNFLYHRIGVAPLILHYFARFTRHPLFKMHLSRYITFFFGIPILAIALKNCPRILHFLMTVLLFWKRSLTIFPAVCHGELHFCNRCATCHEARNFHTAWCQHSKLNSLKWWYIIVVKLENSSSQNNTSVIVV